MFHRKSEQASACGTNVEIMVSFGEILMRPLKGEFPLRWRDVLPLSPSLFISAPPDGSMLTAMEASPSFISPSSPANNKVAHLET